MLQKTHSDTRDPAKIYIFENPKKANTKLQVALVKNQLTNQPIPNSLCVSPVTSLTSFSYSDTRDPAKIYIWKSKNSKHKTSSWTCQEPTDIPTHSKYPLREPSHKCLTPLEKNETPSWSSRGVPYPGVLHVLHQYHVLGDGIKIRHQLAPAILISTKRKLEVSEAQE